MYYVYMIECADGSLYTGIAKDVVSRLSEHYFQKPTCAKYTKSHKMTRLVCLFAAEDRAAASRLEYRIKQLERSDKIRLTCGEATLADVLADFDCDRYAAIDGQARAALFAKAIEK